MYIIETLSQRLGYKELLTISRDEFNAVKKQISMSDDEYDELQKELEELEGVQKKLNLAREIIDGIVECIDDEGAVTPGDKALLGRRVVAAVKFVGNLDG